MSDSGRFFQIVLSISECLPENSSLNNELDGFCPVQIGYVEAGIRNLKEDLHTKIFLILFNRKSGTVHHLRYVYVVLHWVLYLKNAWMDLNATCTDLIVVNSPIQLL